MKVDKRPLWLIQKCAKLLQNDLPRVLDIGSNTGWVFRGTHIRTVSVDLDAYNLPFFVRADAEYLPFQDKTFMVAVLGEILEHVKNPVKVLREAKRVAENMLITVPFEHEWDKKWNPCCTREERLKQTGLTAKELYLRDNPTTKLCTADNILHGYHRRWYDDKMLKSHLEQAGIVNTKIDKLQYNGWSFRVVQAPVEELPKEMPLYRQYLLGEIREGKQPLK